MSYVKHNFQTGDILYASELNEIDDQIVLNEQNIDNIQSAIDNAYTLEGATATLLTSGADLNNYKTPGNFRIGSSAVASSLVNAPSNITTGRFTVINLYLANRILQKIELLDSKMTTYVRGFDGSTWSDWQEILSADSDLALNVPVFAPVKSNIDCVSQIIDIANSYCGVGVSYKANNGPFYSSSANRTGIQCSQFVNCLLQGVYYKDSKLYSSLNTNKRIDGGCTIIDCEPYKSDASGAMSASQLAEFATKNWICVKTKQFKDTQPGDVVFFANESDNSNWNHIIHCAVVVKRDEEKTVCVNAGSISQANNLLDTTSYFPGANTDAVCYQTILDDDADFYENGYGLYGYARFPMYYRKEVKDLEHFSLSSYVCETLSDEAMQAFSDGADNIPIVNISVTPATGFTKQAVKVFRSGKNLLRFRPLNDSHSVNGITFTVVKDSEGHVLKVVANGTATSTASLEMTAGFDVPEGNYWIGGLTSTGSTSTFNIFYRFNGTGYNMNATAGGVRSAHNIGAFQLVVYSGYTANNLEFYPMIYRSDETDRNFEPFYGEEYFCPVSSGLFPEADIRTLKGKNVIYSESGTIALTYRADTKLYIDSVTA